MKPKREPSSVTCHACGDELVSRREDYPYGECGRSDVVLLDVEIRRCTGCSEFELVVPRIAQLHRLLASARAQEDCLLQARFRADWELTT